MFKLLIIILFFPISFLYSTEWENLLEITNVPLIGFNINNNGNGVAVGLRGTCFITSDYGKSWSKNYAGTDNFLSFAGFTPDSGILITGYEGTIVYFEKLDAKFEDRSAEPIYNLRNFVFTDKKNGFMIADKSYLLKSSDGGKVWELENTFNKYSSLKGIINVNNTLYIAAGNQDTAAIFKSIDMGKNWEVNSIFPGENIWNIKNIEGKIWICGAGGMLAFSDDGGNKWNWVETNLKMYITDVEVINNNIWIYANWDKNRLILSSNNKGKDWKLIDKYDNCSWPGKMKIIGDAIYIIEDNSGKVRKAIIK